MTSFKGKTTFERWVNENNRWYEYMDDYHELVVDYGLNELQAIHQLIREPKWQPMEVVDVEHEEEIIELDKIVKSETACSLAETITWVADNIGNTRARVGDAPGKGAAWNLLTHVKGQNPSAVAEFWKTIFPKLLPSSKELENQARYADDGSTQIELANRIKARMLSNEA